MKTAAAVTVAILATAIAACLQLPLLAAVLLIALCIGRYHWGGKRK